MASQASAATALTLALLATATALQFPSPYGDALPADASSPDAPARPLPATQPSVTVGVAIPRPVNAVAGPLPGLVPAGQQGHTPAANQQPAPGLNSAVVAQQPPASLLPSSTQAPRVGPTANTHLLPPPSPSSPPSSDHARNASAGDVLPPPNIKPQLAFVSAPAFTSTGPPTKAEAAARASASAGQGGGRRLRMLGA
jgi:hypothetical protein